MNEVIKQNEPKHECDLNIDQSEEYVYIGQCDDLLKISKQGAKQLIEVLKEWTGENDETNI